MKRRLNEDKQSRHDDPDREGSVSSDEEEDTVPDYLAFNAMAEMLCSESMRTPGIPTQPSGDLPTMHISTQPDPLTALDGDDCASLANEPLPPRTANQTIDWTAVMNTAHTHPVDGLSGKDLLEY